MTPFALLWQGALIGGISGAVGGAVFGGMGGAAEGFRAVLGGAVAGGATAGALNTAFNRGNFMVNVFSGAITSGVTAGVVYGAYQAWEWATGSGIAQSDVSTDTTIRVLSRDIVPGIGHKGIERNGEIIEMGPDEKGMIDVYTKGRMTEGTARALAANKVTWVETKVNGQLFATLLSDYVQTYHGTTPYRFYYQNSNYFVNHLVSAAGGNPYMAAAFAPGFAGSSGVAPRFAPLFLVPRLEER